MSTTSFQRSEKSATWCAEDGHNTPPNSLEEHFLLAPLFVGLPPVRGDVLFGGPFSSWQVALLLTIPMLDAAAPDVDAPPFALSGASPALHA